MQTVDLRAAVTRDEPFLWRTLFEAAHAADQGLSVNDLSATPELARYVENWGAAGDRGVIAEVERVPVGAAWLRRYSAQRPGYAYVNDATPELAIAVVPHFAGAGIGSAMLTWLLRDAAADCGAICLSVREENPARRLYERFGFTMVNGSRLVNRVGTGSITMVRTLR